MTPKVAGALLGMLARLSIAGAVSAALIVLPALAGWVLGVPDLRGGAAGLPPLNPATAVLLLLASAALLAQAGGVLTPQRQWTARILAFLVFEIAALRIQELFTGWNAGFDHTLLPVAWAADAPRMAPATAAAFLTQGFALLALDRGAARGWWASQLASCLGFAIAVLALATHAFGAAGGAGVFQLMPVGAAIAHALLAAATLAARPSGAVMAVALDDSDAGRTFRRMLPIALSLPFLLGWLRVLGLRAGYYDAETGVALAVAANTLILSVALWVGTWALIHADEARRAALRELEENRRRYDFAVEAARIGSWEWDLATDTVRANRTFHELWGNPAEDERPVAEYLSRVHPEDAPRLGAALAASRETGAELRQTFRIVLPDASVRVLGSRGRVLRVEGRSVSMHGVHWDATAEYEAARLLEREREREMEHREAFLSHVSHELRSPLSVVIEFVSLVREGIAGTLTREQAEYLEIASRNAASLKTMIDDLLDATRAQNGKLVVQCRRVAIHPLISETLAALQTRASRKGVSLELDSRFTVSDVAADPQRVEQILVNFVDNAIKFTPRGGSIRVSAEASRDRAFVSLSVSDTGCGIAPENRDRIFDRLYQVDPTADDGRRGLGLGLAICRQLAQLMGGRIWLESQLGQGSTFHVELPVWSRRPALSRLGARCAAGEPLALVTVELETPGGEPLTFDKEPALLDAYRVAGTCVLPDKDVLLPREGPADQRECFHLLARTHPEGAEVLRNRLAGEIAASKIVQNSLLRHRVFVTALGEFRPGPDGDVAEYLDGVVADALAEHLLNDERKSA